MNPFLAGIAVIACVCLIGQAASGFVITPNIALAVLSDCDSGRLVDNCGGKVGVARVKGYTINLQESLQMDSGDKKSTDTKKDAKKSKYKSCNKYKDNAKKFSTCKKLIDKKSQKTKHDTAKNSIGNVR